MNSNCAIYTTVHPGSIAYFPYWYSSIKMQTDNDFELWIAIDGVSKEDIFDKIGFKFAAQWTSLESGKSIAEIRNSAWECIVDKYEQVIFADSDDCLLSTRVETAKKGLDRFDLFACGMKLMDEGGNLMASDFAHEFILDTLVRCNVFGLTNSAFNTYALKKLLPIPRQCRLIDWYLATLAWLNNYNIGYDPFPQMLYRQYEGSISCVSPPFRKNQILHASELMIQHYNIIMKYSAGDMLSCLSEDILLKAKDRIEKFKFIMSHDFDALEQYTNALNTMPAINSWWYYVAHPQLENIWNR